VSATRFVIAGFGRTGSTWLRLLVRSHPGILCHAEIFNPVEIGWAREHADHSTLASQWPIARRDGDPAGFVEAVLADDRGHQAVGIKMLNWHQPELLFDLARSQDVHKVIVRRRNRVRAFLSRTRSEALEQWFRHSYDGFRVRLDPDELLAYVNRYDSFYERLRLQATGTPVVEIVYEDLLRDPQSAQGIVRFLSVEPCDIPLVADLPRQSRDLMRDAVINYDELSVLLRGTPLGAELEE
jgi:LPS sulfotransferase NodH